MVGSLAPVAGGAWRDAVLVERLQNCSQQDLPLPFYPPFEESTPLIHYTSVSEKKKFYFYL